MDRDQRPDDRLGNPPDGVAPLRGRGHRAYLPAPASSFVRSFVARRRRQRTGLDAFSRLEGRARCSRGMPRRRGERRARDAHRASPPMTDYECAPRRYVRCKACDGDSVGVLTRRGGRAAVPRGTSGPRRVDMVALDSSSSRRRCATAGRAKSEPVPARCARPRSGAWAEHGWLGFLPRWGSAGTT
jgi:hypothetical protein